LQYHSIPQNSPLLIIHFLLALIMLFCHIRSTHSYLPLPALLVLLLLRALGFSDLFWQISVSLKYFIFRCLMTDKEKFVWLPLSTFCCQTSGWWNLWVPKWRGQDHCWIPGTDTNDLTLQNLSWWWWNSSYIQKNMIV
jgi:hypothetical protein